MGENKGGGMPPCALRAQGAQMAKLKSMIELEKVFGPFPITPSYKTAHKLCEVNRQSALINTIFVQTD